MNIAAKAIEEFGWNLQGHSTVIFNHTKFRQISDLCRTKWQGTLPSLDRLVGSRGGRLVASFLSIQQHDSSRSSVFLSEKRAPICGWNDGLYEIVADHLRMPKFTWLQGFKNHLKILHHMLQSERYFIFCLEFLPTAALAAIFREVTNVEIKKQPDGTSRGFAFVTFAEKVLRPGKKPCRMVRGW